jgi:hypothetical protein
MGSGQGDGEMPSSDRELWNRRGQDQGRASQVGLEWHWRWGPREYHARRRTEAQQFLVQIEVGIFVGRFVVGSGTRSGGTCVSQSSFSTRNPEREKNKQMPVQQNVDD